MSGIGEPARVPAPSGSRRRSCRAICAAPRAWRICCRGCGDFSEALAALLGAQAPGLSASTIGRLKEVWQDEMERWQRRDLSAKRYVYFWVDGIYFGARLEEEKQCILVIIGRITEPRS